MTRKEPMKFQNLLETQQFDEESQPLTLAQKIVLSSIQKRLKRTGRILFSQTARGSRSFIDDLIRQARSNPEGSFKVICRDGELFKSMLPELHKLCQPDDYKRAFLLQPLPREPKKGSE